MINSLNVALINHMLYNSNALTNQTYANPIVSSIKKSTTDHIAKGSRPPIETAQGKSKITSRSNTRKRIPIR